MRYIATITVANRLFKVFCAWTVCAGQSDESQRRHGHEGIQSGLYAAARGGPHIGMDDGRSVGEFRLSPLPGRSRWRSWQRRGDRSTPTINHTTHERLQASLGRPLVLPSFQRLDLTPGLVSPRRNRPSRYRPLVLCQVFFAHCVTSSLRECITLFAMQHLYWD